ncbi:MAG: hypothetical protein ABJG68_01195 [Crocinitomicaceae bacterium]
MKLLIATLTFSVLLFSCNKEPGQGGTSSVSGKVYRIETNSLGDTLAQYYAPDYDVYFIYGTEDLTYDDKFSTSYDGSYTFTNLTPGSYTVFAYSRCDLCASGDTAVSMTFDITEKKSAIELEDLVVFK